MSSAYLANDPGHPPTKHKKFRQANRCFDIRAYLCMYIRVSVERKNSLPLRRIGESAPPSATLRHYRRVSSRAHVKPLRKLTAKRNAWTRGGGWLIGRGWLYA